MKKVFVEGASLIQSISHFSSCLLLTFRQIGGVRAFAEGANERKNEMEEEVSQRLSFRLPGST